MKLPRKERLKIEYLRKLELTRLSNQKAIEYGAKILSFKDKKHLIRYEFIHFTKKNGLKSHGYLTKFFR